MPTLNLKTAKRIYRGADQVVAIYTGGVQVWPPPEYATVALGIAGVADGARFVVPQPGGYHFHYTRVGSAARFDGWVALTQAAVDNEAKLRTERTAYGTLPAGLQLFQTATAKRWGGRLVENVAAADDPTLTVVDPIFPRDEDGNATPTRTVSGATDPLGNEQALNVSFADANGILVAVRAADAPQWTDGLTATMSVRARLASGSGVLGLGASNRGAGTYASLSLTTSWQAITAAFEGYSGASVHNLGVLPHNSGNTYPFAPDIYGLQIAFDTGPVVLPPLADERASYTARHAKPVVPRPGAIPVDADGAIAPTAASSFTNLCLPFGRATIGAFTMGGWVNYGDIERTGTFAPLLAFMAQNGGGSSGVGFGGLGIQGPGSSAGRLYGNPGNATNAQRSPSYLAGQGWVHLALRRRDVGGGNHELTHYINGVPLWDTTLAAVTFTPEMLGVAGDQAATSRRQMSRRLVDPDKFGDFFFADSGITEDELSAIYMAGLAAVDPDQIKALVLFCADSLMSFPDAPSWDTAGHPDVRPGLHAFLDASGGTSYGTNEGNYAGETRQALRRRALKWGAKHYTAVYAYWPFGTNDIGGAGRAMSESSPFGGWLEGSRVIDAMIMADRDSVPSADRAKVKNVLSDVAPRGDWLTGNATREGIRQAYNADCAANWAARGYDHFVSTASWEPSGFASFEAASVDAITNGGNGVQVGDGIHWSAAGGAAFAEAVLVPFFSQRLAQINGTLATLITISGQSISEAAVNGTRVGTLGVMDGSGSYTFSITSDPDSKFVVVGDELRKNAAMDFEADTSHPVTIQASNGVDAPVTRTFTIAVTDYDEVPPTITTAASQSVQEDQLLAIALTADETIATWAIVGGVDAADFEISGSTLRWASNGVKDFEAPDDADTNNTYIVTVRATDIAGNTSDNTITVTVTDASDTPVAPVVIARSKGVSSTTNSTTYIAALPAGIAAGDRIVVAISCDGAPTLSVDTGYSGGNWVAKGQSSVSTIQTLVIFEKIAEGGDVLRITSSGSEQFSHMAWLTEPAGGVAVAFANSATGGSANADPPNLDPGVGSKPCLIIAVAGWDDITVPTAAPSGYGDFDTQVGGGSAGGTGASIGAAEKTATITSENPGAFTSPANQWVAATVILTPV